MVSVDVKFPSAASKALCGTDFRRHDGWGWEDARVERELGGEGGGVELLTDVAEGPGHVEILAELAHSAGVPAVITHTVPGARDALVTQTPALTPTRRLRTARTLCGKT